MTATLTLSLYSPRPVTPSRPHSRTRDQPEWTAYATWARALRARVARLLLAMPPTAGLRGRDLNALLRLLDASDRALEAVEMRAGCSITLTGPLRSPWSEPMAPSTARTAPRYSRQRWLQIGREVRAIRSEASAVREAVAITSGPSTRSARSLGSLIVAVDEVAVRLAAVADRQHPDWDVAIFDGAVRPNPRTPTMATHRRTWQKSEGRAAALFGSRRQVGSGSGGRDDQTRSDSVHPVLFVESKLRDKHATRTLHDATKVLAAKEGKTPVVALFDKARPGFLVVVHSDDLATVLAEYASALDDAGRDRLEGLIRTACARRSGEELIGGVDPTSDRT